MSWTCENGHANGDDGDICRSCGARRNTGFDGRAYFVVLMGLLAGPTYPVAGGLAWAGMAASVGLARLAGFGELWLVAGLVGIVMFWKTVPLEQRASRSRGYRRARDLIRIVVGIAILGAVLQGPGRDQLPPAEIIGALLLLPVAFFLLRRLDVVLGLAGPVRDASEHGTAAAVFGLAGPEQAGPDTAPPGWGSEFLQNPKVRSALAVGFFPGVLGFALGRDARILSALVLWALVSVVVMLFNGALSDFFSEGHAGPVLRAGAAVVVGGILGAVLDGTGEGFVFGGLVALAGVLLVRRLRRRKG